MALIYEDSDWSVAQPTGSKRWLRPFPEVNVNFIYEQDYTQSLEGFLSDGIQIGSVNEDDETFYLVEETTPQSIMGGMVRFTRTWSRIPASRTDYESFAFTFPGIEAGAVYTPNSVSGNTGSTSAGVTTLSISGGDTISYGDSCRITYNAFDNVQQYTRRVIRTALVGTTGGTLKVDQIVDSLDAQPLYFFEAVKIELGREPITETVASLLTYDYFLPGVSPGITSFQDISLYIKDIIIDSDGLQTDTYSDTTTPSTAIYRSNLSVGDMIVAEDSVIRRWKGPILERVTRYVRPK